KAYFYELQGLVSAFSEQVKNQQEEGKVTVCPEAEWVLLKVIKRKWSEPRWTGPYKVTERTSHTVRLRGKGETWFHWSQCAGLEEPQRSLTKVQEDLQAESTEPAGSEEDPTSKGAE
ncbi:hypothetical protein GBF38_019964, partial [Nibea albiflora]